MKTRDKLPLKEAKLREWYEIVFNMRSDKFFFKCSEVENPEPSSKPDSSDPQKKIAKLFRRHKGRPPRITLDEKTEQALKLRFKTRGDVTYIDFSGTKSPEQIKNLNLRPEYLPSKYWNWDHVNVELVGLEGFTSLTTLRLSQMRMSSLGFLNNQASLNNLILELRYLNSLGIDHDLPNITGLLVRNSDYSTPIRGLPEAILHFPNLEYLVVPLIDYPTILDSIRRPECIQSIALLGVQQYNNDACMSIPDLSRFANIWFLGLNWNATGSLDRLPKLPCLEALDLSSNPLGIEGFKLIRDMKTQNALPSLGLLFVVGSKIDWYNPLAGQIAHSLMQQGVRIYTDQTEVFYEATVKIDWIGDVISIVDRTHKLTDQQRSELSQELEKREQRRRIDPLEIIPSTKGFTSTSGFEFYDHFIKLDKVQRLRSEHQVYQLDLKEFKPYMAEEKGFTEHEGLAVLVLNNLAKLPDAQVLSQYRGSNYVMYLMGLFHKEARKYALQFDQVLYEGVHKIPHYDELLVPHANTNGEGYRRFTEVSLDIGAIIQHVTAYRQLQASADCLIDGDWKDDNMVNGRKVDFAMVGRGFEVDELAYYFSDFAHQHETPTLAHFHQKIDEYARIRITHDPEFHARVVGGYLDFLHSLGDSSLLTQLVLRMSVMNKRDMLDFEKFEQRQYYQYRINQVLREGRFV